MAVSPILQAIGNIFKTPEFASRIPANVATAIQNGEFGTTDVPQPVANAIMDGLVDKISRQDIYSFEYNNFDASKYEKGYLPYGGIIEDDYIEAQMADNVSPLPSTSEMPTAYSFDKYDPFKINYPTVKASYYTDKIFMQYSVTTTLDIMKRAFTSEQGAIDFINRVRGVLPESGKLDKYLIFREMISSSVLQTGSAVSLPVAGSTMTAEESINIVKSIRNYVSAFKWNTTKYNRLGALTSSKEDDLVLFMAEGIHNEIVSAQYNAYHKDLDFGCKVQLLDGFGKAGTDRGLFAVLADERGIKIYKWQSDRMDNIWNPKSTGYWNTFYSFGDLMGYAMHRNYMQFNLTSP